MNTENTTFQLGGRTIGESHPALIIAEIAQAHDGSLGMAHAYIDAVARCGADAVKFQTHIASAESTIHEPWRIKFSLQDVHRYDYWERMEFSEEHWHGLKRHALERGLIFLSSPFSVEAADLLDRIGVDAWKVASGEINSHDLLHRMTATGKPLLFSTGMSTLSEVDKAVGIAVAKQVPYAVFQCSSTYPTPPEKVGLNMLHAFRERYRCPVGLSDHSGKIYPGLAAAVMGIDMLEVHITMSRDMFGPDVPASVTTDEFARMVEGIRYIEKMIRSDVDKDSAVRDLSDMRSLFTKSVVMRCDLPSGTVLKPEHLTKKKPGTGIPAEQMQQIVGRRLGRNVMADDLLQESDLE